MRAQEGSTRTVGYILLQLLYDLIGPDQVFDRLLKGPTDDVWLNPWVDYLQRRGIPERNLIAETQGSDTAQSAVRVAVIMRANGLHSCVAVSDAYHVFRIKRLLEHEGIGPVYTAPRPDSRPHSVFQRAYAVLREASSYLLWRIGIT